MSDLLDAIQERIVELEQALAERDKPTCPDCGSDKVTPSIVKGHTSEYGGLGTITYDAPIYQCGACSFQWTGAEDEDAQSQAIIKFLHEKLAKRTRERDALALAITNVALNTKTSRECPQWMTPDWDRMVSAIRGITSSTRHVEWLAVRLASERKAGAKEAITRAMSFCVSARLGDDPSISKRALENLLAQTKKVEVEA